MNKKTGIDGCPGMARKAAVIGFDNKLSWAAAINCLPVT